MTSDLAWQSVALRDLCEVVQYGYTASATDKPVGPKFLRITDIVPETIDWSCVPYCEIDPQKLDKYLLRRGDIVIARTGATTGYAKYIRNTPEVVFASYLVRIRLRGDVNDRYAGYVVESSDYKRFIQATWGGAAQPNANAQVLTSYEMPLPPLPTQRKIASILSAYDDLIENNLRRIKILEEMAQTLYREWFVKFRFPGHEKARMVDSPLGKIPDGWDVTMLGELVEIQKGKKPKTLYTVFEDGLVPYLLIDVMKGGDPKYTNPEKTVMAKLDDIVMIMDGASSGIAMIGVAGAVGSTLARFRPFDKNALSPFLLLLLLRHKEEEIRTKNVGSAIPHANKDYITSMEVSVPTEHINKDFDGCCRPLFSYILNLSKKNVNLRRTRDLLLPKLISGELDVSDLDIKTGGHMQ